MTGYNLNRLKVMIVDDHLPMRRILQVMLKALGIAKFEWAVCGEEAIAKLAEFEADIIITDQEMTPVNGIEMTRQIRSGEAGLDPFVPIIIVSGHSERENIEAARDAGVHEFLAKPVSAKQLYSRIRNIIERPRAFIRTAVFFGPDRRRKAQPYDGPDRRQREYTYPD